TTGDGRGRRFSYRAVAPRGLTALREYKRILDVRHAALGRELQAVDVRRNAAFDRVVVKRRPLDERGPVRHHEAIAADPEADDELAAEPRLVVELALVARAEQLRALLHDLIDLRLREPTVDLARRWLDREHAARRGTSAARAGARRRAHRADVDRARTLPVVVVAG